MAGSYTPPFPTPSAGTLPRVPAVPRPTVTPPTALERPLGGSPQAMLQRHSSSVKSSSPLAGAPIRGHRIRSSLDTTASQSESTSASAASSVHEQTVEPLIFGKTRSTHLSDKPCEDAGDGRVGRSESADPDKPRGTVLLRGGFGQFGHHSPSREKSPLTSTAGVISPVGSAKFSQTPRGQQERDYSSRYRQEGERNLSLGSTQVPPILSAGAQPLDQGVRSWTNRRSFPSGDNDAELHATPTRNVMYTAPASLESRRLLTPGQTRRATSTCDDAYAPTFYEAGETRRASHNIIHKASDDGDDSIVGNLEMSGA
jgi:hypothetical protein